MYKKVNYTVNSRLKHQKEAPGSAKSVDKCLEKKSKVNFVSYKQKSIVKKKFLQNFTTNKREVQKERENRGENTKSFKKFGKRVKNFTTIFTTEAETKGATSKTLGNKKGYRHEG